MAKLVAILSADAPAAWQRAGFALRAEPVPQFLAEKGCTAWLTLPTLKENLAVGLVAKNHSPTINVVHEKSGILGWIWSGSELKSDIGAFPTTFVNEKNCNFEGSPETHPNGLIGVDHIVLKTADMRATLATFEAHGVSVIRERSDIYPGVLQAFLRPQNDTIIEVVSSTKDRVGGNTMGGMLDISKEGNEVWGLTLVSKDIDNTADFLSPNVSKIRQAQQKGRKIATLRNTSFGLRVALAIMSPHLKAADSKL
mmetsp:Transcript_4471/g.9593  ORF Transcript_4471/g.9593 Transcript_4471/m.9593 type:complete len:254 (+) Transcript_4471:263-1024(+)|eukprot:CAMPEP_0171523596 /NCGR_PEP_ID=MMETSP0959-20130129/8517_1 /TAXON_ID=87120 /ORGANISM="Aurantiochytrium limacinum, Strain ATCCMYA-1381" /LENGTH=253 /DNA_ID=CAMNT_0012064109 /DNA_START=200 /DNA_END=961 /DNA_ORIENTATION=-